MRTAIVDGPSALNANCICCAFGPGSIANRGLLFGAETASRNRRSEWDALSGTAFKRKLHPILSLHSGTRFPQGASSGKRIPFRAPIPGRAFRLSFTWKLRPSLSVYSGMQFPQSHAIWKAHPILSTQSGTWFPRVLPTGKCVPVWQADGHKLSSPYSSISLSHVGSMVWRMPAVCSFFASMPAERTSIMVKRMSGWP